MDVKLRDEEARRLLTICSSYLIDSGVVWAKCWQIISDLLCRQRGLSAKANAVDGVRRVRARERVGRAVPAPEANAEIQANLDVCDMSFVLFLSSCLISFSLFLGKMIGKPLFNFELRLTFPLRQLQHCRAVKPLWTQIWPVCVLCIIGPTCELPYFTLVESRLHSARCQGCKYSCYIIQDMWLVDTLISASVSLTLVEPHFRNLFIWYQLHFVGIVMLVMIFLTCHMLHIFYWYSRTGAGRWSLLCNKIIFNLEICLVKVFGIVNCP